jgi:diguanylate cyclase (GGDEF)-like protein
MTENPNLRPIPILLVDDNAFIREFLTEMLSAEGHSITGASSAEEALMFFKKNPFPLVITDIVLEGMSGLALLKTIKQLDAETEVILITSFPALDSVLTALRIGAFEYLNKTNGELDQLPAVVERAAAKIAQAAETRSLLLHLQSRTEHPALRPSKLHQPDPETGLYNGSYFQEILDKEVLCSKKNDHTFSILLVKNCTHYGNTGDLKTMISRLKSRLRKSDVLTRQTEDCFAILLPETGREGAHCVAASMPETISAQGIQSNISIGLATYPEDGGRASTLLQHAEHPTFVGRLLAVQVGGTQ